MAATLVTIAVSHYCEKARWSLDRAGRPYVEKAYSPGAHRAATALHGGTSTPLLVTKDGVLKESTDIVRWADEGLFLAGDDAAAVAELVADFDARLGPATRALAYIYVTADTETFARVVTPGGEPTVASRALAMGIVPLMRRALGLNEPGAEANARATIDAVFADVADRLADGRRYLVGDTFSAADMTFAALAAPRSTWTTSSAAAAAAAVCRRDWTRCAKSTERRRRARLWRGCTRRSVGRRGRRRSRKVRSRKARRRSRKVRSRKARREATGSFFGQLSQKGCRRWAFVGEGACVFFFTSVEPENPWFTFLIGLIWLVPSPARPRLLPTHATHAPLRPTS